MRALQVLFICFIDNMKKNSKNRNYYINIADWMLDFKLPTNLLLTYAIVYGYCQAGENCYWGSTEDMAWLLGIKSSGHATEYLNALEKKGLLHKEDVKKPGKQKMCKYYVTTNREGKVEEQNVDYITIQPWMFKTLGLKNSQLLIYARIQNLSRTNNVCFYNDEDLAFWADCEKRRIRGFVNKMLKDKIIEEGGLDNIESYRAIIPSNIEDSKKWSTYPKTGGPCQNNPNNGALTPKSGDNNLSYNLILDNLKDNNTNNDFSKNIVYIYENIDSKSGFDIKAFQDNPLVQGDVLRMLEAVRYDSGTQEYNDLVSCFKLIDDTINAYSYPNIKKISKLNNKQKYEIFKTADKIIYEQKAKYVETPEKILASKINKYIKSK